MNNPLMVDTFLFLSGFLMCRILIYEMDKRKGHINVFIIYFARYLRLTPAYAITLFFYCTLFKYINNGPLWNYRILEEQNRCIKSWWSNLLYINNYVNTDYICMFQSWYLAVDTQLFLIAPIFIYTLWYKKRLGIALLTFGTFISAVIPFMMTLSNKLDPTLMAYAQEVFDLGRNSYFVNTYIKTHMRATSYFFGLILGFTLHHIYVSNYELSKPVIIIGWMTSFLCGLASLFSLNYFYQPSYKYNDLEAAIYSVFHRIGWCISIGWLIIACSTNNAGPIRKLFCWQPFIVLTRLTYCAYLTNGIVLLLSQGTIRTPLYISMLSLIHMCSSQILLTFALALILCLFFESPIHAIEKILLKKYESKLKDEDNIRS